MKNQAEQGRKPTHEWRFFWDSNPSHISLRASSTFGGVLRKSRSAATLASLPLGQSKQTFVFQRLMAETVLFCIDFIYAF